MRRDLEPRSLQSLASPCFGTLRSPHAAQVHRDAGGKGKAPSLAPRPGPVCPDLTRGCDLLPQPDHTGASPRRAHGFTERRGQQRAKEERENRHRADIRDQRTAAQKLPWGDPPPMHLRAVGAYSWMSLSPERWPPETPWTRGCYIPWQEANESRSLRWGFILGFLRGPSM